MMQVVHNSTHQVASGRVPAKVSCSYLECPYTRTHTQGKGDKEGRELKQRAEGEEGCFRRAHSLQIFPSHSYVCLELLFCLETLLLNGVLFELG